MKATTNTTSSWILKVWWLALFIKIVLGTFLPLTADEAYYWVWSLFPDWSYYDHPGMVAWLFGLAPYAENLPGLSRLPFILMGHLTLFIWLRMMSPKLDERFEKLFFLILLFHPFTGLGSLLGTPDVPLLFFWSLALYFLSRLREQPRRSHYALLGASLGLGFCSKYMIVLFVPALLIHILLLSAEERARVVSAQGITLALLAGLLFSFPVLFWNSQNDWISFKFQTDHGLGETRWNPKWTSEYLLGQLLLLFPPLIYSWLRFRPAPSFRWLTPYAFVPLVFFALTSLRGHVEANWPLVAYPTFFALVLAGAQAHQKSRWIKITIAFWAALNVVAVTEGWHHWVPVEKNKIKIHDFSQYDPLFEDAQNLTERGEVVFTGSYQMASVMSFRANHLYPKLPGINRHDFYDELQTPVPTRFYLLAIIWYDLPAYLKESGYEVLSTKNYGNEFKLLEVEQR